MILATVRGVFFGYKTAHVVFENQFLFRYNAFAFKARIFPTHEPAPTYISRPS